MSPIKASLLVCLLAFSHQITALKFIDAISSESGTAPLNFSSIVFNQPFTVGWVDGSGPVDISIWSQSDASSTYLETVQKDLQPSGSAEWIPTTSPISAASMASPPKNINIIGARADADATMHLQEGTVYRMTISDDETTVFSPSFSIAAEKTAEEGKSGKKGLSRIMILGIVLSIVAFLVLVAGAVAFAMYRKRAAAKAARNEVLMRKVNEV